MNHLHQNVTSGSRGSCVGEGDLDPLAVATFKHSCNLALEDGTAFFAERRHDEFHRGPALSAHVTLTGCGPLLLTRLTDLRVEETHRRLVPPFGSADPRLGQRSCHNSPRGTGSRIRPESRTVIVPAGRHRNHASNG